MKIGYVWKQNILRVDAFADWQLFERGQVNSLAQHSRELAQKSIDDAQNLIAIKTTNFAPYTDLVFVSIDTSREIAWERFIVTVDPDSKVLVEDFEELSLNHDKQMEYINLAKARNILVVPLDKKELIDLNIDAAYSLLLKLLMSEYASKRPRSGDANYEKMLTLMKQGKGVVEILEATGWSRSTLFRLRRECKTRLAKDLPSFKKRYE